ncbi:MAG: tRNA (adenosine(37)-N6)-threonylcarbamoyltransferase complex ATPase subunit type 1 TsaE [Deltaproteobacteria bacterium]|jgi:tRNA threonylcarbamoyladenosine biosynthesis protein TsaE|nr:tRNA (adenosine(37)-N6)-threonylcarbamoyltransferase complex ATPase subunit type 1 TsaE [Deltaproteobacteria bacterium]
MAKTPPMSNDYFQITTDSVESTKSLGEKLGSLINIRTIFALIGNLGSGKTSFVQGLAKGLDVPDNYYITSPSFTLVNEYPGKHKLFHIDLYRIDGLNDFEDMGLYEILEENGVIAIEWADKLSKKFLSEHVTIHFEICNENLRKICITSYGLEEINLLGKLKNCY